MVGWVSWYEMMHVSGLVVSVCASRALVVGVVEKMWIVTVPVDSGTSSTYSERRNPKSCAAMHCELLESTPF